MSEIGDAQFHVMCEMWGVDAAAKAARRMGMEPSREQIEAERREEEEQQKRWNDVFRRQ